MSLYLRDATFIDWRSLAIERGDLEVEEGAGGAVRFVEEIPAYGCVYDCGGRIVTKSFAIGHHHIYSALARGMPARTRMSRRALRASLITGFSSRPRPNWLA